MPLKQGTLITPYNTPSILPLISVNRAFTAVVLIQLGTKDPIEKHTQAGGVQAEDCPDINSIINDSMRSSAVATLLLDDEFNGATVPYHSTAAEATAVRFYRCIGVDFFK